MEMSLWDLSTADRSNATHNFSTQYIYTLQKSSEYSNNLYSWLYLCQGTAMVKLDYSRRYILKLYVVHVFDYYIDDKLCFFA